MFAGHRRCIATLLSVALGTASCSSTEPSPIIEISPDPIPVETPTPAREKLDRLTRIIGESPARREAVEDIIVMLRAQDHEGREEWDLAVQGWLEGVKKTDGRFGKRALEGWTQAYSRILGAKTDPGELAKVLLAETQNGKKSPYLAGRGLSRFEPLRDEIARILSLVQPLVHQEPIDPFVPKRGIPLEDPLLERSAKAYCRNKSDQGWDVWFRTLDAPLLDYWRAKIAACQNEYEKAVTLYKTAIVSLARKPQTATLSVNAAEHLVALYRSKGEREAAADAYVVLMKAFEKPGVNAQDYGESPIEFAVRRINSTLWAARYRAMVGDYGNGKIYAQEALDLINKTYAAHSFIPNKQRDLIVEMRAEAYHVMAFRIALEEKDYDNALAYNRLGGALPNLKAEWKHRFQWFNGLYLYLGGRTAEAVKGWEEMLAKLSDAGLKPQLYFWLARGHHALNDTVKSEFYYKALLTDYPMHYYSLVASPLAGFAAEDPLTKMFGSPGKVRGGMIEEREYDVESLKRHRLVGPLLFRSEILVAADSGEWANLAVRDLAVAVRKNFRLRSNRDAYVYLSRLLYRGGDYPQAISLSYLLARDDPKFWGKYPEQIFVFFPRPFADVYDRYSEKHKVKKELLYAISRQESKFDPTAKSGAGAFGVMQLIPVTAKKFALVEKIGWNDELDVLLQPEVNIRLGSSYVRFLENYYKGNATYLTGAYNAGEYVVDAWLDRRSHDDPLVWVELIPFGETKEYVRSVLRNLAVYNFISAPVAPPAPLPAQQNASR